MTTSTLEALNTAKARLAVGMNKELPHKQVALLTQDLVNALESHLKTDPQYVWGAGKDIVRSFNEGPAHAYFAALDWEGAQEDAKAMLDYLRECVVWQST